ncbi:sigma D regulator [Alteromonas gilva]|uniref:Sigma D regulator n=1 Tax=Alteromonas gilva TaxID=2987522 RepID=A0ABT5KYK6_9ALTE|nr:sigma D regulator [Alteromonas gilva]MDC8829859.1 sigma D regulator [Alteromonas gilva]
MLNQVEIAKQRWGGANKTIDAWLDERRELLIKYCQLAGVNGRTQGALPDMAEVDEFCSILMDYLSVGHFEVYEMLVSDDPKGLKLKQHIFPRISDTTNIALDFNDKFSEKFDVDSAHSFDADITRLGEALVDRFELEDQLIKHIHVTVNDAVPS